MALKTLSKKGLKHSETLSKKCFIQEKVGNIIYENVLIEKCEDFK